MTWIRRIFDQKYKKLYLSAIHECGHCFIAYQFKDDIEIEYITLNPETIAEFSKSIGISPEDSPDAFLKTKPKYQEDDDFWKSFIKVSWAGFIAENIERDGYSKFLINSENYISNPNSLHSKTFGADYNAIQTLGEEQYKKDRVKQELNDREYVVNIFKNKNNWGKVKRLAESLMKSTTKTLSFQEIEGILE